MTKHKHGGRVFEAAADLGVPWEQILDFSANINPLGQPPGLKEHLFSRFSATIHYPDVDASNLTAVISKHSGLDPDTILPGAGSTPHIRMLSRFFQPLRPAVIVPAFAEYEESLTAAGSLPLYVFTKEEDGFLAVPELLADIEKIRPDALFLANPANPTGLLAPAETLSLLAAYSDENKIPLIIDEAFIDFTSRRSIDAQVLSHPHLIVLRSLTKIFAVPGLRLAYLTAAPDLIRTFRSLTEPWHINFMALEAGIYSMGLKDYLAETPKAVKALRSLLEGALRPLGRLIPSDANFVLMKLENIAQLELIEHLYKRGILIRDASNFKGLGEGYVRFAVRPEKEILRLGDAVKELSL